MRNLNFDAAVAASKQVAEAVKALRSQREQIVSTINLKEAELQRHNAAPLPEADLGMFFAEYADVCAERGRKALAAHLDSILYPVRYETSIVAGMLQPLSFEEITAIVHEEKDGVNGWLADHVAAVIPSLRATGVANASDVLNFLLRDQIKAGISRHLAERPPVYREPVACGLPLIERRERVAVLNAELTDLRAEKCEIEAQISKLNGGRA